MTPQAIAALVLVFAAVVVITYVFAAIFFLVKEPFVKVLILILAVLHLSGCVGDLYGIGLFLFRFQDPAVLRLDTGPKQIYYTKD